MVVQAEKLKEIQDKLKQLSEGELDKVADFAEFLKNRHQKSSTKEPSFEWAGALEEFSDEYDSVELQHKISEWWAESVSD